MTSKDRSDQQVADAVSWLIANGLLPQEKHARAVAMAQHSSERMDQLLLKSPKLHQKLLMQSSALVERDYSESIEYQHVIKSSAKILQFIVKDLIDLMNIKGGNFNP